MQGLVNRLCGPVSDGLGKYARLDGEHGRRAAWFMHYSYVDHRSDGVMMQAETIKIETGAGPMGPARQTVSSRLSLEPAHFWRLIPILFGLAAWVPQILAALASLRQLPAGIRFEAVEGGLLKGLIVSFVGPDGLVLVGALLAGLVAYSIWAIARAIGAPRWAAAAVTSVWVVAPIFGLAPSPVTYPDDAAFAAFMSLALAAVIWAGRRHNSTALILAFVLAILASLIRPGAAWPAIAIGVSAFLASDQLEEGPIVGTLSALCWAPGLQLAHYLFGHNNEPASLTPNGTLLDTVKTDAVASLGGLGSAGMGLNEFLSALLAALPFVVFGIAALAGIGVAFFLGGARRRGAIAALVSLVCIVFGAIGYGSGDAARLLLDPILLGLAAGLGLIIPALIDRAKIGSAN
jgi:hypothetical protein